MAILLDGLVASTVAAPAPPPIPNELRAGGGFIVHLNCGDGRRTAPLRVNDRCLIQGLEPDPGNVAAARALLQAQGLYGPVSVVAWEGPQLPYADGIVNFLVADEPATVAADEILRVLVPGGRAVVAAGGGWREVVKPWPREFDGWTHFEHDPGRSSVSEDLVAGPPQSLCWLAGEPSPRYSTFDAPPAGFVTAGGGNFYWLPVLADPAKKPSHPTSRLLCRDAFNGLPRWTVDLAIPAAPPCMVAAPDRLYVHQGPGKLSAYGARDGKVIQTYDRAIGADLILLVGGTLMIQYAKAGTVAALDVAGGSERWRRQFAPAPRRPDGAVAGTDGVYVLAQETAAGPLLLHGLDLGTGKTRWATDVGGLIAAGAPPEQALSLVSCRDGLLVLSDAPRWFKPQGCANHVVSCRDGAVLWSFHYEPTDHGGRATNVLHIGDTIWIKTRTRWVALDARTGTERRSLPVTETRCYPDHATARHLYSGFMDFLGLEDGALNRFQAARSGCASGFFPANGRVYSLPTRCNCYPMVRGYLGLSPAPPPPPPPAPAAAAPAKGPAFGRAMPGEDDAGDWPMHRADASRSASTKAKIPAAGRIVWSASFGGRVSPATAGAGMIFASVVDRQAVVAVAARDGKTLWRVTADARVDSPPTYAGGCVVFGCADGSVTCLAAKTGDLVWRRRVAPGDRSIVVREQVESPWPVHGSVLVAGGKVYAAAGRHTLLDGGLVIVAIDLVSGAELWRRRRANESPPATDDLLIGGDAALYLGGSVQLDPADGAPRRQGTDKILWAPHGMLAENFADPACGGNDRWFSRWVYADKRGRETFDKSVCHPRFSRLPAARGDIIAFDGRGMIAVCQEFGAGENSLTALAPDGAVAWQLALPGPGETKFGALAIGADGFVLASANPDGTGQLSCRDRDGGAELRATAIPAAPVWDGLVLAYGRLFVATGDGRILCVE
jgi:outer membrane protein assembly factor BamB